MPAKSRTKMGKKIRDGLKAATEEAKSLITPEGETAVRVKPSEMRDAFMVYLQKNQYDPIQELINLAMGKDRTLIPDPDDPTKRIEVPIAVDASLRTSIHKEFLRYLAPAMKVSDPDKGVEAQFEVYINNFVLSHAGVPKQEALDVQSTTTNTQPLPNDSPASSPGVAGQSTEESASNNDCSGAEETRQPSVTISSFAEDK